MGRTLRIAGFLERRERAIVVALAIAYALLYATLSILKHQSFHSTAFDLAVFDQIYWNTREGRPFESTMDRAICEPHSFFGSHISLLELLIYPLYFAVPRVETLLGLQTAALAAGVWPLYLLARRRLARAEERLVWVAAYFLFVPLAHMNLFDFHGVTLAILPLGFALYFLETERTRAFLLSLLVAFLVKEEVSLTGLAFGAYAALAKRRWALGGGVAVASALWFALALKVVIPFFAGGGPYAYLGFYARLGDSEVAIVRTVLTDPATTGAVLGTDLRMKLRFLAAMFGPGLGLAALSGWGLLLPLPALAYSLLSDYSHQYSLRTHYAAPLIPVVLGISLLGMARLQASWRRAAAGGVLLSSLVFAYLYGNLPFSAGFDPALFRKEARYDAFMAEVRKIPPGAHVAAEDFVATQMAQRRFLYYVGHEGTCDRRAEYVILDVADPQTTRRDLAAHRARVEAITAQGYAELARGQGLVLLRRR